MSEYNIFLTFLDCRDPSGETPESVPVSKHQIQLLHSSDMSNSWCEGRLKRRHTLNIRFMIINPSNNGAIPIYLAILTDGDIGDARPCDGQKQEFAVRSVV